MNAASLTVLALLMVLCCSRNLLRLYVAPFIVFSLLVACTMFIANGQYRLDTSEHRAETLQVVISPSATSPFAIYSPWNLL